MDEPRRRYPWKVFLFLWLAGTLTAPLVLPYFFGLIAIAPHPPPALPQSPLLLVLFSIARSAVMLAVAAGVGLLVARKIGLGAPYLEHWLEGAPAPAEPLATIVKPAVVWATVTAIVALAIDAFFFYALDVTVAAPEIHARIDVAAWRSGLASFWAPWSEEVLDRLFLMSLVAWLLVKLFRVRGDGRGRTVALWAGNLLSAVFFGVYHISNEALFVDPVPTVVAIRTVLIITPVGLAFGWLYLRRGLEAAILSHFVIDILVHVVRPVAEGWLR